MEEKASRSTAAETIYVVVTDDGPSGSAFVLTGPGAEILIARKAFTVRPRREKAGVKRAKARARTNTHQIFQAWFFSVGSVSQ